MEKTYRKIKFEAGQHIESAMKELKGHDDLVCGSFNGKMLYSDIDDLDSAYIKIVGITRSEFDKEVQKTNEEYEEHRRKYKESIPELTKVYIESGNAVLEKKYHKMWERVVPIRLNDMYEGMELRSTLEIVKELNKGCKLEDAKKIIENQGHSGMSFGLVCSMVKLFSDRGHEFVNYVSK